MTYAIISVGDKQFWISEGDRVLVPRRQEEEGATLEIQEVLWIGGNGSIQVGKPYVSGAGVTAKVRGHLRGPKVVTFKFRRRTGMRKTIGHRQPLTELVIERIRGGM
ncbi:MAG: 50S ribosomal protein L21 [Candidatus Lindowbacteria bacterium RIFCSPLOWO2_12_FULL_62_27]|nr:MAG: 50S ribosomal protein L21 [Candidatus Lindowbacteria bacterium RIFCSPLOWO2_12_FULL_62_27]OGH63852.1 MAG: 50S ribosomal protein L21 [Candidatus Lindowbacteria bacterium RIFCSPLOWO2_02_FULL_62_12]